jgi:hypothetical protein
MTEPEWWPRDPPGYVFLGRVLEKIGAGMHEDWAGTEATTDFVLPLPADRTSYWDRQRADILLSIHRPDLGRPTFNIGTGTHEFTDEHWQIACDLAQRLHEEGLPGLTRLQAAQAETIRQSIANELILEIRPISGGPWRTFQTDWWNVDEPEKLFRRCRIDPEYPFGSRPSWKEDNDHWIFATENSLARVLKRSELKLKWAPDSMIIEAIADVYDAADKAATKPPNINELPGAVLPRLNARGYTASGKAIKRIGGNEEFVGRRGKVGVRRTP